MFVVAQICRDSRRVRTDSAATISAYIVLEGLFGKNVRCGGTGASRLTVICKKDCRSHFFALARGRVCTCFECGGGACAMSRRRTAAASLAYEIG